MIHLRLILVCLVASCLVRGQDYEEERSPALARPRAPRGPLVPSRANSKQAVQKTSTTEAPPEEELEYEEELAEEEPAPTTTTEPPRKGIRGGVVRPFRSNADLIEALKRRRAQAQSGGSSQGQERSTTSTSTTTQGPGEQRQGRKSKWSRTGSSSTTEQPGEEQPAPRSRAQFQRGRRF